MGCESPPPLPVGDEALWVGDAPPVFTAGARQAPPAQVFKGREPEVASLPGSAYRSLSHTSTLRPHTHSGNAEA